MLCKTYSTVHRIKAGICFSGRRSSVVGALSLWCAYLDLTKCESSLSPLTPVSLGLAFLFQCGVLLWQLSSAFLFGVEPWSSKFSRARVYHLYSVKERECLQSKWQHKVESWQDQTLSLHWLAITLAWNLSFLGLVECYCLVNCCLLCQKREKNQQVKEQVSLKRCCSKYSYSFSVPREHTLLCLSPLVLRHIRDTAGGSGRGCAEGVWPPQPPSPCHPWFPGSRQLQPDSRASPSAAVWLFCHRLTMEEDAM